MSASLYGKRRAKNLIAQTLAVLATVFGLFWLAWIMWTTLSKGITSLNLDLDTQMTPPPGDEGGMLNAFFGSAVMSQRKLPNSTPCWIVDADITVACCPRTAYA